MSVVQNIKEHGDLIEYHFAEDFGESEKDIIEKYNLLWGNYVGNDSKFKPLLMNGKDKIDIQKCLYKLVESNELDARGSKTYREYSVAEKKRNGKEK